ncbi:MAG: CDP-alcohol phosphatidyltransferase family protein [Candidatus Hodarchaeales archaeon]
MDKKFTSVTFPNQFIILAFILTSMNLLCGIFGIIQSLEGNVKNAFQFLLLGAFFDLVDGKVARMAPTKSELGAYYDSLSDLVSFVVLPGYLVLSLESNLWLGDISLVDPISMGEIIAGIYAISGWFRLVRFGAKPSYGNFEGLPSAAAAMLIGALTVIVVDFPDLPLNIGLTIATVTTGILMSSKIAFPSPKRMFQSDNILITVAAIVGAFYVIIPNVISALLVLAISLLYTVAGPRYLIETERLHDKNIE